MGFFDSDADQEEDIKEIKTEDETEAVTPKKKKLPKQKTMRQRRRQMELRLEELERLRKKRTKIQEAEVTRWVIISHCKVPNLTESDRFKIWLSFYSFLHTLARIDLRRVLLNISANFLKQSRRGSFCSSQFVWFSLGKCRRKSGCALNSILF